MENPFDETKKQRPVFLSVICILTFIGSGWGALSSLFSLIVGTSGNSFDAMYSMMGSNPEMADMMSSTMDYLQTTITYGTQISVIQLVLTIISLIGAIMMFRLKRLGFYLYAAAQVVMLFVMPYFAGYSWIVLASFIVSAVFAALFIILYAVNLKHME